MTALSLAGCSKTSTPKQVSLNDAGPAITNAFAAAPTDLQMQAGMMMAAARGGDLVGSYAQVQALSKRPDLTPEQRRAAFDAERAVLSELKTAATNGNPAAEAALQHFRMSK